MSEDTAQPSETPEVAPAPTLDSVISEFAVDKPATPAAEPSQPVETTKLNSFDPLDESSVSQFTDSTNQVVNTLQGQIQSLSDKLTQREQVDVEAKFKADLKGAVDTVSQSIEGADPLMVELYLEKVAIEKPGFQQIWHNRDNNPKALEKALSAVANELNGKMDFKADPQIAENHRAATQSNQSSNSTSAPQYNNSLEERLANASETPGGFESEWHRIKSGGS
jgi:hypothetical protein